MWDLIVSVPDHCLSIYFTSFWFWYLHFTCNHQHIFMYFPDITCMAEIPDFVISWHLHYMKNFNRKFRNTYLHVITWHFVRVKPW